MVEFSDERGDKHNLAYIGATVLNFVPAWLAYFYLCSPNINKNSKTLSKCTILTQIEQRHYN